uniref:Alpha-type protein kinase domain-containing protein n=1 Tax=Strigamia maritima TaxID=126957 RepID=T1IL46_STRMM
SRNALHEAAKLVTSFSKVETAKVFRLVREQKKWVWQTGFEIKCLKGKRIGSGSFRDCFEIAISDFGRLPNGRYVIKTWNDKAAETLQNDFEIPKKHEDVLQELSRRAVQCQNVACGLATEFKNAVNDKKEFGTFLRAYIIEYDNTNCTLEERIDGVYTKYINNNMILLNAQSEYGPKCSALAHFSYNFSERKLILSDLQGSEEVLTDPEIASFYRYDTDNKGSLLYGIGNYGNESLDNFKVEHECSKYCMLAGLVPL